VNLWTVGCAGARLTAQARSPMDKPGKMRSEHRRVDAAVSSAAPGDAAASSQRLLPGLLSVGDVRG
jgi:hypothetical protein